MEFPVCNLNDFIAERQKNNDKITPDEFKNFALQLFEGFTLLYSVYNI